MILYRFTSEKYSADISGEGARRYGGRWNSKGNAVLYCSCSVSLSLLELFIHKAGYDEIKANILVTIEVPDVPLKALSNASLKKSWQPDIEYCRFIGDSWLASGESLLLKLPSAIIPQEYNILINPAHPDFKRVAVASALFFEFDARLFK
ncbi:RES family NAD+ phosphorylase [Agriterribacter sp.]|uniref:RES family NAD+ phosphorylase n=1 Tax=Agriterribacter sp. TaxID=2821509 RepID=UPI002BDA14FD|nr:RES family NAD+ phosphorylase [Agriterribacter sp.]HRP55506.1 RES family NAD+ phosphorylase [Agriterribacter sp.]